MSAFAIVSIVSTMVKADIRPEHNVNRTFEKSEACHQTYLATLVCAHQKCFACRSDGCRWRKIPIDPLRAVS